MANGDTPIITPWWQDKGLYVVLLFVVTMICNKVTAKWGVALNPEEIVSFAVVCLGFIGGHKWKSATLQKAEMAGAAASAEVVDLRAAIADLRKKVG